MGDNLVSPQPACCRSTISGSLGGLGGRISLAQLRPAATALARHGVVLGREVGIRGPDRAAAAIAGLIDAGLLDLNIVGGENLWALEDRLQRLVCPGELARDAV